ncbi:MAG: GNAT family N-acetyltransferase [Candidatus Heimdallarchaeota archaeon]|nr:MAG: GNAT family N-acetyltransferase [Candidatus Heimdallarchaeota archaeon]
MTKNLHIQEPSHGSNEQQSERVDSIRILYPNTPQMMKIRELLATLEDTGRLADCVNEWSDDDSWGGGFGATKFTAERILKEWFATKQVRRMVVDEEGIIQGYCSIDNHWTDEDSMYAELLGVRPSQQKKGFGKGLLLKAVETATQHGKRRLDLHTWAGNLRAVPVYKKTGFMWCPKTSVLMENFMPAILNTGFFKKAFFSRNDWYESRILTVTQKADEFEKFGMKSYFYHFVQDKQNSLTVYIDRHAKEISGFSHVINGEELSVQLVPNLHEVFFGIDSASAELRIINNLSRPIVVKGNFTLFKGIEKVSIESIDVIVEAGTKKHISIEVQLNPEVETYIIDQVPWKRTDCRLYGNFLLDNKEIQLAIGWVPKESLQVTMSEPSAYFGRYTKQIAIPIGFRNMMNIPFDGHVKIIGEGLPTPHEVKINLLEPSAALETQIMIKKPKKPIVTAWRWNIRFYHQKSSGEEALPPIIRYISCFTKAGAVAYVNPHKEAVVENEQLRFHFDLKETNELRLVKSRDVGEFTFSTLGMNIGKPFPAESSEFWRLDRPYEIIKEDSGVSFKQVMLSKVEKPGLQVTRWINVEGGKPFISSYYEMTNTSDLPITNIAIRLWSPWRTPSILLGKYFLPLKSGWIVSDDPEFNDNFDFPQNAEEYAEPWIAKENQLGFGCGLIWDSQVETIRGNPYSGPMVDTKAYTLQPGETIKLGHFTWVFGRNIAPLTRKIWLNEFNGSEISSDEDKTVEYSTSILEVRCGQDLAVPGVKNNPLPGLNWIDGDSRNVPIEILYHACRETSIEAQIDLESTLWKSPIQWKMKLEGGINKQIRKEIDIKNLDVQLYTFKGVIQLPYTSRPITGALIPYRSTKRVILEKKEEEWLFSNNLLSFQTSPTHGASLFSGKFSNSDELFFSRFPNRDSFVWFKRFVGGFHPFLKPSYSWNWLEFLDNTWSSPVLVTNKDKWFGLTYHLDSPVNDFRLKNISCRVTYYTRSESPLLWSQLSIKNNSGISTSIQAGFFLFLKPIEELITKRHNDIWTYRKTERERVLHTIPPDNWALVSFGEAKEKILLFSPDPKIPISGDYMNANNYSEMVCSNSFKLPPGKERRIDVFLLFNNKNKIEEFQAIVNQWREVIHK